MKKITIIALLFFCTSFSKAQILRTFDFVDIYQKDPSDWLTRIMWTDKVHELNVYEINLTVKDTLLLFTSSFAVDWYKYIGGVFLGDGGFQDYVTILDDVPNPKSYVRMPEDGDYLFNHRTNEPHQHEYGKYNQRWIIKIRGGKVFEKIPLHPIYAYKNLDELYQAYKTEGVEDLWGNWIIQK